LQSVAVHMRATQGLGDSQRGGEAMQPED